MVPAFRLLRQAVARRRRVVRWRVCAARLAAAFRPRDPLVRTALCAERRRAVAERRRAAERA